MLQAPRSSLLASGYSVKDLFTGQRWVSDIGLYDDRNRFMSPDLGRFLQPDPIGFKGDATNLYRYCGNDWANRSDPMGLEYVAAGGARATESRMKDDRGALAEYAMLNLQRINFRDAVKDMAGFTMGTRSLTVTGQFTSRGQDSLQQGAPPSMKPGRLEKVREEDKKYFKWVHYQLKTASGAPLREGGFGIVEHMKVIKNTAGADFKFTEKQSMPMYKGEGLDRVGPKLPPSQNTSGDIVVRQTFGATYGGQEHPLSTVVEQRTHIDHGATTVEVPVIKP